MYTPKGLNKRNHRFRERNLLKFITHPHYLNLVLWGRELPDVKTGFRKGRGTRDQIAGICWLMEKQENSRKKKSTSASTTMLNVVVWITTNWKILEEMGIPDHLTCLLRNLYAGQETTEPHMEQWTSSKLGKEYIKAVYCHLAYLIYMQSTSFKMLGWMKLNLESRLLGKILITSDMQTMPF